MQILYVIPYNLIDCNQTIYLMYFDHEKSCLRSIFRSFSCFFNIIVQSRLVVELYHFVKHGGLEMYMDLDFFLFLQIVIRDAF